MTLYGGATGTAPADAPATPTSTASRERGWLGTQLRADPQDADPPDGHSDFGRLLETAETTCRCGAGEHRECECWKRREAS
jgi:hypothetical protein